MLHYAHYAYQLPQDLFKFWRTIALKYYYWKLGICKSIFFSTQTHYILVLIYWGRSPKTHFHRDENYSPSTNGTPLKIPWTTNCSVPPPSITILCIWWLVVLCGFLLKIDASVCGQLCFFFSLKTFYLLYPRLKRTWASFNIWPSCSLAQKMPRA